MRSRSPAAALTPKADRQLPQAGLAAAVLLCFLLSGATSLILEGTLTRLLRFVLGNTALAVTTVLCAFMAGLALGSYVAGQLCDRRRRLLRVYGLLEGAVGVSCLLLPACIDALQPVYRSMYAHLADFPLALSLARFLLCGLLLLIPSTFMGATLPVLSRWYALRFGQIGGSVARLYAINSAGAGAGALLGGFLLLPGVGVTWTLRLACGAAIAICALMLLLDRRFEATLPEPDRDREDKITGKKSDTLSPAWQRGLLVAYGLSGAAALVYEVAWTRALALVVGSTTYAFSLMLTAFIVGLAIGSAIMVRLVDRLPGRLYWFAAIELGIGLSAMAALPVFGQMPIWVVGLVREHRESFAALQAAEFGLILLVMMVPTTLMGAAFPLVSRACATGARRVGRSVGGVYAANTVGGILGAFLASFLLIPHLGTQSAILVAVAINILIGAVLLGLLWSGSWVRRGAIGLGAAVCCGLVLAWFPPWDPWVMASGAYLYADSLAGQAQDPGSIRDRMHSGRLLFHKEDMCTTVTVRDDATGARLLAVGGKVDASTAEDVPTQLLLAHAPLLLHPHPRSALVIGLASGMTLGSAACHDLERIDCVEISPAVVEASHYFDDYNGHALADPRVRLILADGRNHLALTSTQYDVIISEPSNPWIAGVSDLFTEEFFQICRQRLAPQGLACVWLQAYQMEEPLFRSVIRTFSEVFRHVMIVEASPWADYLLIGSDDPMNVPLATLTSSMGLPKVAADLQRVGIAGPGDFLRRIVLSEGAREYAGTAAMHTDDNALLEFAAPRGLYRQDAGIRIAEVLNRYRRVDWSFLGRSPAEQPALSKSRLALDSLVEAQRLAMDALVRQRRGDLAGACELAERAGGTRPSRTGTAKRRGQKHPGWRRCPPAAGRDGTGFELLPAGRRPGAPALYRAGEVRRTAHQGRSMVAGGKGLPPGSRPPAGGCGGREQSGLVAGHLPRRPGT